MEGNAARLVERAIEAGYYPDVDPPEFSQAGGLVETGFSLEMTSEGEGTIYYTTNGSDPRMPVTGELGPGVMAYDQPLLLEADTHVKARVLRGQVWSALQEARFDVVEQDNRLRVSELMYNPLEGDDYEFIELKNVGNQELELANLGLIEGIYFTFPADTPPLGPGETVVLVSNPDSFAERYPGVPIAGVYEGNLSNKGEQIILADAQGQILLDITYGDDNGWPVSADGRGDSLVLVDESGNPNNPITWRASLNLNGSPGADEPER
jgi:hypothetical protein